MPERHSVADPFKVFIVPPGAHAPGGIFIRYRALCRLSIPALRLVRSQSCKTSATARGSACKWRLRLCGKRLLMQPAEQFQGEVALFSPMSSALPQDNHDP